MRPVGTAVATVGMAAKPISVANVEIAGAILPLGEVQPSFLQPTEESFCAFRSSIATDPRLGKAAHSDGGVGSRVTCAILNTIWSRAVPLASRGKNGKKMVLRVSSLYNGCGSGGSRVVS